MKLLGSTENKTTKDKNSENVTHFVTLSTVIINKIQEF